MGFARSCLVPDKRWSLGYRQSSASDTRDSD